MLSRPELRQHCLEPLVERLGALFAETRPYAPERDAEPIFVEGLQQVVDGVDVERPNRVLVVRGHEHDDRELFALERIEHAEAVELRHLHVEKHEVGPLSPNDIDGLGSVARLTHEREALRRVDERAEPAPDEWLVIGDDNAHVSHQRPPVAFLPSRTAAIPWRSPRARRR